MTVTAITATATATRLQESPLDPRTAVRNELLGHAGIRVLESVRFNDPEDGPAGAGRLGYPVALKTTPSRMGRQRSLRPNRAASASMRSNAR